MPRPGSPPPPAGRRGGPAFGEASSRGWGGVAAAGERRSSQGEGRGPRPAAWLPLVCLAGCDLVVEGQVVDLAGAPVAGATLRAQDPAGEHPACDAVTDAEGRFRVACPASERVVAVRHPGYLDGGGSVRLEGHGTQVLAPFRLGPIPEAPGVHVAAGTTFVTPAAAPLRRTGSEAEGWRWCLGEGTPPDVPAGPARMLENRVGPWRLLRADDEGCVYRLRRTAGGFWSFDATFLPVEKETPLAEGREWYRLDLAAGTYVVADWVGAGFVPEGDGWRATWFRVAAPAAGGAAQ